MFLTFEIQYKKNINYYVLVFPNGTNIIHLYYIIENNIQKF